MSRARFSNGSDQSNVVLLSQGSGGGSGGNDVEKRVEKLENTVTDIRERLVRVETKVDAIEKNMATKTDMAEMRSDLHKLESTLIKWFVGTSFALVGIASAISFGVARLLN